MSRHKYVMFVWIIIIYKVGFVMIVCQDVLNVKIAQYAMNVEYHIIWTNKWDVLVVYKTVIIVHLQIHALIVNIDFIIIQVQNNVLNAQKNVRPVLNIHYLIAHNVLTPEYNQSTVIIVFLDMLNTFRYILAVLNVPRIAWIVVQIPILVIYARKDTLWIQLGDVSYVLFRV
jgi:hypothetical protein